MIFLKSFLKSLIVASFITMIVGFTIYSRVEGTEVDIDKLVIDPQPTIIYDKDGNQIAKFIKERKDVTEYEDMPKEIEHALISTEDRDFYDHVGINPKAILRAVIHDIKVGSFDQGGSTITQQLTKNIYLTTGKTLDRKVKEAIYATAIESQLSKKEILTYYINHSDFVYNSFGIRNAIETYFGQTLDEFKAEDRVNRIAKSALLMGMLQSPTQYNPFVFPEQAETRRNIVIHNMLVENYITKEEYDEAIKKPLLVLDNPKYVHDDEKMLYPEIVSYVLEEIRQQYGLESVEEAKYVGKNIYTSFDPKVYELIRKQLENKELYPADAKDGTQVQAAITVVNPKNGEILALSGGRQAPGFLEFNRAYQGQYQPGSIFKPIISYGPAFESGKFTPDSIVPGNSGYNFGGGYTVRNFGGANYGNIPVRRALAVSANVPAVYMLQQTGINFAFNFAEKQGIKLTDEDRYLPVAIGALSNGVNTLQMTDAYQGYSNGGYRIPAHIIKKIVNHNGEVEYEAPTKTSEKYRTMSKDTAKWMKDIMREGVLSGTSTQANVQGQFIAGKTGTAELAGFSGRNQAIWFAGYSESYVATVWMGFDNPNKVRSFSNTETSWLAARMFGQMGKDMAKLYPSPLENYKAPEIEKPKLMEMKIEGYYAEEDKKVILWWDGPADSNYKIYRNGELLHETDWDSFENITIKPGETYTYKIESYDKYTDTQTGVSNEITITTGAVENTDENSDDESTDGENVEGAEGTTETDEPSTETEEDENASAE